MESKKEYLMRLGEISLKGLNRRDFERQLALNVKSKLGANRSNIRSGKGRMHLEVSSDVPDSLLNGILSTTFGISFFARCYSCKKDLDEMDRLAEVVLKESFEDDGSSFKVDARREDKGFALSSYQIECRLADIVHKGFPSLSVCLKNPKHILHVEVRDRIYIYSSQCSSPSGLPVGSSGKALCLLSGGIDSPVAAYMAASRGLHLELVYFHAYPYTGDEALDKVKKLAEIISPYLNGTVLHVVNFTPMEKLIETYASEREKTLMLRAAMIRVAEKIARKRRCGALVTGESLAQVASQTLEALDFTTSMTNMLVMRPLIGMDKEAITILARKVGTYETSILPYSDCCSLFSPSHPMTRPNREKETKAYFAMTGVEETEDVAVASCEEVLYNCSSV